MSKAKDGTDYAKAFLEQVTGTVADAEWKRTKKEKVAGGNRRTLVHKRTGAVAVVEFSDGSVEPYFSGYKIVSLTPGTPSSGDAVFSAVADDEYTGRVIFGRDDDGGADREMMFYLGRETTGGYLDDQHNSEIADKLRQVLVGAGFDKGRLDIETAESMHAIHLDAGETADSLYEKVKPILIAAGAVEKLF